MIDIAIIVVLGLALLLGTTLYSMHAAQVDTSEDFLPKFLNWFVLTTTAFIVPLTIVPLSVALGFVELETHIVGTVQLGIVAAYYFIWAAPIE